MNKSTSRFEPVWALACVVPILRVSAPIFVCALALIPIGASSQEERPFRCVVTDFAGHKIDVVLGETTLGEALKILPPWPGYGPSRPKHVTAPGKVADVLNRIKQGYNPRFTNFILHFDKNNRLVIVEKNEFGVSDGEREKVKSMISKHELKEVARD